MIDIGYSSIFSIGSYAKSISAIFCVTLASMKAAIITRANEVAAPNIIPFVNKFSTVIDPRKIDPKSRYKSASPFF